MKHSPIFGRRTVGALLLCLVAACGGGPPPVDGPAVLNGTLAYVTSDCRETAADLSGHQTLRVRRGEREPVVLREIGSQLRASDGTCTAYGVGQNGSFSVAGFPLQRLGVSPDGSTVVYEITDDHLFTVPNAAVPPEEEGIFLVRTDGSDVRYLGPASREPAFRLAPDPVAPTGLNGSVNTFLGFNASGTTVVFPDLGPDGDGAVATQIFALDLATGGRTQLTHLPPKEPCSPYYPTVWPAWFVTEDTVSFTTCAADEGLALWTLGADGKSDPVRKPPPVAVPGATFVPTLIITSALSNAFTLTLPEPAENPYPYRPNASELFAQGGDNLLQLTRFNRSETAFGGFLVTGDNKRITFTASADPFGTNPHHNCQWFSMDTLGGGLRQLTSFSKGGDSRAGCANTAPPGCSIWTWGTDRVNDSILFASNCDPLGTNPNGEQLFATRADGTGLWQLTDVRGMVVEADGTISVELPNPSAYVAPAK